MRRGSRLRTALFVLLAIALLVFLSSRLTRRNAVLDDAMVEQTGRSGGPSDVDSAASVLPPSEGSGSGQEQREQMVTRQMLVVSVSGDGWTPIPGARVTLLEMDDGDDDRLFPSRVTETTDDQGRVVFTLDSESRFLRNRGVHEGTVYVLVQKSEYSPSVEAVYADRENDVRLYRATSLEGRVLEFETLAPIAGARVVLEEGWRLRPGNAPNALEAVSDIDGNFRLEFAPLMESVVLSVIREGHQTWQLILDAVKPGASRMDLLVPRGKTQSGRVVDADDGSAVAGVRINCLGPVTTSDANGYFQARGLQPGRRPPNHPEASRVLLGWILRLGRRRR